MATSERGAETDFPGAPLCNPFRDGSVLPARRLSRDSGMGQSRTLIGAPYICDEFSWQVHRNGKQIRVWFKLTFNSLIRFGFDSPVCRAMKTDI